VGRKGGEGWRRKKGENEKNIRRMKSRRKRN
jgi:hypothetical protein